ncbi:glycosyltransferase family 1 protein [Crassisporium funariophilum]|nr:glycosyltransferase family 1 protein [Crassisporium funariophilum]
MSTYVAVIVLIAITSIWRLYVILPKGHKRRRLGAGRPHACKVAIFLGSGGHTSEALTLLSALDFRRYSQRLYIVSQGDDLSVRKAMDLEMSKALADPSQSRNYSVLTIPRARRVHQPLLTTPFSAILSLLGCIYHLTILPLFNSEQQSFADVLIINGPGTCFVLCVATYINKFCGLQTPVVIYVESFARVQSLSLSGKLIRPFADRFVTQWPMSKNLQEKDCSNWLV